MIEVHSPGQTTARSRLLDTPRTPESVAAWALRHLDALEVRRMSRVSLKARKSHLAHFNAWCVEHGLERPHEVTHAQMEAFQRHLYRYRRRDGQPLSASGQNAILGAVNTFFSWLVKHRHLPSNPAADVELPRAPKGLRDRAMLELLYGTGIRRMELAALNTHDIERERGTLHVRRGKGGKGRFVPIGERALAWVTTYEAEARP